MYLNHCASDKEEYRKFEITCQKCTQNFVTICYGFFSKYVLVSFCTLCNNLLLEKLLFYGVKCSVKSEAIDYFTKIKRIQQ